MKINKSKLKNMVEKGAPVAPVSIKRKRVDEGQSYILPELSGPRSKRAPTTQAPSSIQQMPPIVQIPDEEIAVIQATDDGPTSCRSHGLMGWRRKELRP